ncbi:glycoside hydrolase family 15 protein [Microterricola viridarii]|uniref:Glucoamylase n=1 Tax=Microterricola viridarii TaxID=412690 RepID=A0A120I0W5_9MICO|nr:glycoside hydrolase family 15 protein [Microterricola viridarii]AMB58069.1 glucoamylase [Microterricola viridarii]
MALNIEDYALISDCQSGALVGLDGSIDWLCLPRFDSASMFGALLGNEEHGRWRLAPSDPDARAVRSYVADTFILSTVWTTSTGQVEVRDFMPHGTDRSDIVRWVRGISGSVEMHADLRVRFGYASSVPWMRQMKGSRAQHGQNGQGHELRQHDAQPGNGAESNGHAHGLIAVAGPDACVIRGPRMHAAGRKHVADFTVAAGEEVEMQLNWYPSHRPIPEPLNVSENFARTAEWWASWASSCSHEGPFHEAVVRSMLILRALTNQETGGIAAAATTSLPEQAGGSRNWDYRYVWLRDASLSLKVLLGQGYEQEAEAWRGWLMRAIAGDPGDVQIMYGMAGERELPERVLTSLPGYRDSGPVRVGNAAVSQFQSDVIGEVMVALHAAREAGVPETDFSWPLQRALMAFLEQNWQKPDQGIWEMRGPARAFTHSRVMVWAAFDRAVRAITEFGLEGPLVRWTALRDTVRQDIEERGFSVARNSYTQFFGSEEVDAALLALPQVGFCEPDDPRMLGTVAAIEQDLLVDSLLLRYRTRGTVDGLPSGENHFVACSFWLVEQYAKTGRYEEAHALMSALVALGNDVGLLSEEYDRAAGHQAGNTPQALSHLALIWAAEAFRGREMPGR